MKTFGKYLLVGVVNTSVTLVTIYVLIEWANLHHVLANFSGYALGVLVSFVLNKRFTFRAAGSHLPQFAGFLTSFGFSYLLSLLVLLALVALDEFPYWLSTIASMGVYTLTSFALNKYIVFSETPPKESA